MMKPAGWLNWVAGGLVGLLLGSLGCRPAEPPAPPSPPVSQTPGPAEPQPVTVPEPAPATPATPASPTEPEGETGTTEPAAADATPSPAAEAPLVPLVDQPEQLQRLQPTSPIWFDKANRQVVLVGVVCQNRVPLELFACQRGSKEHESILSIDVPCSQVHAGLLAAGAVAGAPAQFQPQFVPAHGTEIEVTVVWKDAQGERQQARGQDWVRQTRTQEAMSYPWVFAGSSFVTDQRDGRQYYQADWNGDLICVSNFPTALLDLPVSSSDSNEALLFDAFTERIPPLGTPVTLLLKPKAAATPAPSAEPQAEQPAS